MMTRLKFREWVRWARRNERVIYYRGNLARDRGPDDRHLKTDDQFDISALADAVRDAARKKEVLLFQKANGQTNFDYYAVRT